MSDLDTALSKPPPERRDGKIQFDSLQPTIRISDERFRGVVHVVLIGHRTGSRANRDLVWADVRPNRREFFVRYTRDVKPNLSADEFFTPSYKPAKWLHELLNQVDAREPKELVKPHEMRNFVRGVVHLVLEDCIGDDLQLLLRHGSQSLRQYNRNWSLGVPTYIKDRIAAAGLRPRYYSPIYLAVKGQPVIIKEEDRVEDVVQNGNRTEAETQPGQTSNQGAGKETQLADNDIEHQATAAPNSSSVSIEAEPQATRLEAPNATNDDTAILAEMERIIVRPAKEKAVDMIEEDVRNWRDGNIDDDTLEKSIQARLSEIRLARQMQDAVVASKATGENSRKRKADGCRQRGLCGTVQGTSFDVESGWQR